MSDLDVGQIVLQFISANQSVNSIASEDEIVAVKYVKHVKDRGYVAFGACNNELFKVSKGIINDALLDLRSKMFTEPVMLTRAVDVEPKTPHVSQGAPSSVRIIQPVPAGAS